MRCHLTLLAFLHLAITCSAGASPAPGCFNRGPKGAICAAKGHITDQNAGFGPSYAATVENAVSCRGWCLTLDCVSLSFDPSNGRCLLYKKKLKDAGFVHTGKGSKLWYGRNCFDCLTSCAGGQSYSQNLLLNGGFEATKTSFAPWFNQDGGASLVKHGFNESEQAVKMGSSSLQQRFYLCPRTNYYISFYYKFLAGAADLKTPGTPEAPNFRASLASGRQLYSYYDNITPKNNGTWQNANIYVVQELFPLTLFDLTLSSDFGKDSSILLDRITIYRDDGPVPSRESLLQNGFFENGELSPFDPSTSCTVVPGGFDDTKKDAKYAVSCITDKPNDGDVPALSLQQTVIPEKNKAYYFDGQFKKIMYDKDADCRIGVTFGRNYYGQYQYPEDFTNNTWNFVEYNYYSLDTNSLLIQFDFHSYGGKRCDFLLDHLYFGPSIY